VPTVARVAVGLFIAVNMFCVEYAETGSYCEHRE
jgi:hypothetical protein